MFSYLCFKKTNIGYQFLKAVCFDTLAFVFLVIRQYFRFGDVSLKACKVFATFQFVSPIRTQRTKCPSVCSSGLNLYFFSALCRADSLSEGVALQGEACACSKVWLEWKVMRSIETSKPDHGEMIRLWIYCWNDPF